MEHVITISDGGKVEAMHTDSFPLSFLGKQHISRASDIRHDADTNSWGIWVKCGDYYAPPRASLRGFNTYEEARHFEIEAFNCVRFMGYLFWDAEANDVYDELRAKL